MFNLSIERAAQAFRRYGRKKTAAYGDIREGLFPPQIRIGARASGFLSHEVDAVIAARAAGVSDAELRDIVTQLVAKRKSLLATFLAEAA